MPNENVLQVTAKLVQNPYPHTVNDNHLFELLMELAVELAAGIKMRYDRHEYESSRLALVLLDPTAPVSRPSEETVLAIILIGEGAEEYVPNATAKAFEHRDKGANIGDYVYAHTHRLADGSFRWGHSVCVDGTYVGASGLTEVEDRHEGTLYAAGFNYRIDVSKATWREAHPDGSWYCDTNEPGARFQILNMPCIKSDSHVTGQ